jgi:hypothetical protein
MAGHEASERGAAGPGGLRLLPAAVVPLGREEERQLLENLARILLARRGTRWESGSSAARELCVSGAAELSEEREEAR